MLYQSIEQFYLFIYFFYLAFNVTIKVLVIIAPLFIFVCLSLKHLKTHTSWSPLTAGNDWESAHVGLLLLLLFIAFWIVQSPKWTLELCTSGRSQPATACWSLPVFKKSFQPLKVLYIKIVSLHFMNTRDGVSPQTFSNSTKSIQKWEESTWAPSHRMSSIIIDVSYQCQRTAVVYSVGFIACKLAECLFYISWIMGCK